MDDSQEQHEATPQVELAENPIVEKQIAKKKRQSRSYMALAVLSGAIVVIGVIAVAVSLAVRQDSTILSLDEQLKADANRLGLAVVNWNNGKQPFEITPANTTELGISYITSAFNDPRTGDPYVLTTTIPAEGEMQYVIGGICNQDDSISQSGSDTNFAIRVLLEDTSQLHCVEKSEITQPRTN